jgi:hypothetical protein
MKTHIKFQIILTVSLFFVIALNANAQNGYSFDNQSKVEFNHFGLDNPAIEHPHLLNDNFPKKFLKNNFTEDLLDSMFYIEDHEYLKETFIYEDGLNRITRLRERNLAESWYPDYRTIYTYDDNSNLISELAEQWDGVEWEIRQHDLYTYNNQGNLLVHFTKVWNYNTGDWINNSRFTFSYSTNSMVRITEFWKRDSSNWKYYYKETYNYKPNGDWLYYLKQDWDDDTYDWKNNLQYTDSYNEEGIWIRRLIESWNNILMDWHNYLEYTMVYDSTGNKLERNVQIWQDSLNTWSKHNQYSFTYDTNNNTTSWSKKNWNDSTSFWIDDFRHTYSHDNNNNMIYDLYETWNSDLGRLDSNRKYIREYDQNNNLKYFDCKKWTGYWWIPQESLFSFTFRSMFLTFSCRDLNAYYSQLTDINDSENLVNNFSLSQNYPNPFNPSTKIKFTIPTSPLNPSPYQGEGQRERLVTLKVYDILGNEITTLINEQRPPGTYEIEFYAQNLPSGVYFYQITASSFNQVKKMLLLK